MLVIRIVVGLLFIGHGTQKLFGWFGGGALEGTGGFFESLGYRPGKTHAGLAGLSEAGGGLLLVLGLLTPLGAAAIIGVMVNAIVAVHLRNGLWVSEGGMEYPLVAIAAVLAPAFAGPGDWSLDNAIGWDLAGTWWGLGALVVGIVTAGVVLLNRRVEPEAAEQAGEQERRAA